jgi:hypothetical protein
MSGRNIFTKINYPDVNSGVDTEVMAPLADHALITIHSGENERSIDKWSPKEGYFVFATKNGYQTHFSLKQNNDVQHPLGAIMNSEDNGSNGEETQNASLCAKGKAHFIHTGTGDFAPGTRGVVLTPDHVAFLGFEKGDADQRTQFTELYFNASNIDNKDNVPALTLPHTSAFFSGGLARSTAPFWAHKNAKMEVSVPDDKDSMIPKLNFTKPMKTTTDDDVSVAVAPELYIKSHRKQVRLLIDLIGKMGGATDKISDIEFEGVMKALADNTDYVNALACNNKAHDVWMSSMLKFICMQEVRPGDMGTCTF